MRALRFAALMVFCASLPLFANVHPKPKASNHKLQVKRRRSRHAVVHRRQAIFRIPNSPVRGSRESLLRQNERIDEDSLERIQDDEQLNALVESHALVPLPENRYVTFASNLPDDRRFSRPWTVTFLNDIGRKYYTLFQTNLQVNSAVRTVEVQHKLLRWNHNAAAETGDLASPHLSGAAVDIYKRGMTRKQLSWMRNYLLELQNDGLLDAEEEFRQPVFHITVYRQYDPEWVGDAVAGRTALKPASSTGQPQLQQPKNNDQ